MVKVVSVEAIDNHKLRVLLSNNRKGIFDVSPYLNKGVFRELRDQQYFRRVRVAYGGVVWPQEASRLYGRAIVVEESNA